MKALLYATIILLISACTYSSTSRMQELDEAKALLAENPVKALERLNRYDISEFEDSATMARWALLYGEALAANNLSAPTDTIINIAIDYYEAHKLHNEYSQACSIKERLSAGTSSNELALALYTQKEKEFSLYRERGKRNQILLVSIIIILSAVCVILWQRQRIVVRRTQNENLIALASSLRDNLNQRQSECNALASKLSDSMINRFGMIDELCQTYYESQGSGTEKKAIVGKVKECIEALREDRGIFTEMECCHKDFLCLFRKNFPGLKSEEYRLIVYLCSGLSNRSIALLIDESIDVVYKRKSRLKAKIANADIADKERFLTVF